MAAAAAQPSLKLRPTYNPLSYGDTGGRRTNAAVAHDSRRKTRHAVVSSGEQFTNELIAPSTATTADFRAGIERDLLRSLTSIPEKQGKPPRKSSFHTFNALYEAGRQIGRTATPSNGDSRLETPRESLCRGRSATSSLPDVGTASDPPAKCSSRHSMRLRRRDPLNRRELRSNVRELEDRDQLRR